MKPKTPRNRKYLDFIALQDCILAYDEDNWCFGQITAHHSGKGGMGIKCSDYETLPLCFLHHQLVHCNADYARLLAEYDLTIFYRRYKEAFDGHTSVKDSD